MVVTVIVSYQERGCSEEPGSRPSFPLVHGMVKVDYLSVKATKCLEYSQRDLSELVRKV